MSKTSDPTSKPTDIVYLYHPESNCVLFVARSVLTSDKVGGSADYSLCSEITEEEYIDFVVKQALETKTLPKEPRYNDTVDAIITGATNLIGEGKGIWGQVVLDRHNRFINGQTIHTSPIIQREPGGIYKTKNSTYLVQFLPNGNKDSQDNPKGGTDTNG